MMYDPEINYMRPCEAHVEWSDEDGSTLYLSEYIINFLAYDEVDAIYMRSTCTYINGTKVSYQPTALELDFCNALVINTAQNNPEDWGYSEWTKEDSDEYFNER